MITAETLAQAMKEGHLPCRGPEGCVHEDATNANMKAIEEEITRCVGYAMSVGVSPALMIWSAALHVGYKLHELETAPVAKEKIN